MTLNELVAFYTLSPQTQNQYGTLSSTRTLVAEAYARVRPLSGRERNQSDQTEDSAMYRFYIHRRSDLSGANILVWNGVDYNVKFIADMPKEPYIYIDAERGVAV
jgi:head-tail adaptor